MLKAINAWSVDENETFSEMFKNVADAGFEAIELNLDPEGRSAHSLYMSTTDEELKAIKQEADKAGLKIQSVSTLFNYVLGDPQRVEEAKAIIRKQIAIVKAFGGDTILIVPGGNIADGGLQEAHNSAFNTLLEMKEEIEREKVYVGLENIWNGFFTSPFDMAQFIDKLNCPYIKAYYDVGNTVAFSDTISWIKVLGNRIQRIHIKGYKRVSPVYNRGGAWCDLLDSTIDWDGVFKALKEIGYDKTVTAEMFPLEEYADMKDFYKKISSQMDVILKGE